MSYLTQFRDHALDMSTAEHQTTCAAVVSTGPYTWQVRTVRPDPECGGCVTAADRALWGRLASEVDAYLHDDNPEGEHMTTLTELDGAQ